VDITLRRVEPSDESFLYRVYASTREDELAIVDWTEEQKQAFVQMQFSAQHRYYQEQYSSAAFQVVLVAGQPVGRLYVDRRPEAIHIIDVALLPEYRNRGIGTTLLEQVLDEGRKAGKKVSIHVEQFNPALKLYGRLGFTIISHYGIYYLMERQPE